MAGQIFNPRCSHHRIMANTDHNLLTEHLKRHLALGDDDCIILSSRIRTARIRRKEFMLRQGQVAKDAAFVLSGCLRAYSVDDNGFEHILQFAAPGWWITDMYSWISGKGSHLQIDAIRESHVALLSRKDQLYLFDRIPGLERYFRILTENNLVSTRQRIIESLSLTAKQRYQQFCRTYPDIIDQIPQKLIASYIGVTPEFLSKILAEQK
jgi:CRP-like cAMP-binding protein